MTTFSVPRARSQGHSDEGGVSSLEFLGIMLVAGSVVGALAFTVGSESAGDTMGRAFCSITSGGSCADGGAATAAQPNGTDNCVGAPLGAAGPVRGLVRLDGNHTTSVGVMGDGTFQVYGGSGSSDSGVPGSGGGSIQSARDSATPNTWASRNLSPGAVAGLEPFFTGQADRVYSAKGPNDLAGIIAADSRQTWSESVFGDSSSAIGAAASSVGDLVLSSAGEGKGLPAPSATFDDTSAAAGLSLNAYAQTVALDSGGEAVGVVHHENGATTEVFGVSEGATAADDVIPMLLHVDRDPSGNLTAVRTVADRDLTGDDHAATSSLFITHLDATGPNAKVAQDLISALGSAGASAPDATPNQAGPDQTGPTGSDPTGSGAGNTGTPPAADGSTFDTARSAFVAAALRDGYVTRQAPAGTVATEGSGVAAIEAGLRQVTKTAQPESFNGMSWTPRPAGCGG